MKKFQMKSLAAAIGAFLSPLEPTLHRIVGTQFAVNNYLSASLTNRDATPRVLNAANVEMGNLRRSAELFTTVNGDSIGSTYRLFRIRSSDIVSRVRIESPDIGTTTAADLGLYDTTKNGSAVVDADFFASAVVLNAGAIGSEIKYEAGAAGGLISNANKRVWEALGLSADPLKDYDVVLTLTGAADAAATGMVEAYLVSGE